MGLLWDILQKHMDTAPYQPSERAVARRLGVAPNTLAHWRDLKRLPTRENLEAIAALAGVRYSVVLDAALRDTGYHESATVTPLRRRPDTTLEAELRAAEADLEKFNALNLTGQGAEGKRAELQAAVDALKTEIVSSRPATGHSRSVADS